MLCHYSIHIITIKKIRKRKALKCRFAGGKKRVSSWIELQQCVKSNRSNIQQEHWTTTTTKTIIKIIITITRKRRKMNLLAALKIAATLRWCWRSGDFGLLFYCQPICHAIALKSKFSQNYTNNNSLQQCAIIIMMIIMILGIIMILVMMISRRFKSFQIYYVALKNWKSNRAVVRCSVSAVCTPCFAAVCWLLDAGF